MFGSFGTPSLKCENVRVWFKRAKETVVPGVVLVEKVIPEQMSWVVWAMGTDMESCLLLYISQGQQPRIK